MSVQISLVSPQIAGGSGADSFRTDDFADAAAAVAAVSGGFLVVHNPIDASQTDSGKSRAIGAYQIRQISTL